MKKKIIVLSVMLVLVMSVLLGCESASKYVYNIQMVEPEPQSEPLTFSDETLAIKFTPLITATNAFLPPSLKGINVQIRNLSDKSIKVLWDDVSFIDIDNSVQKIMHQGVKYTNRGESMSPTSIPAGTLLEDTIIPTDIVSWSSITNDWVNSGIVNQYNAGQYHQEKIGIMLPIEHNGETKEYLFRFKITAKSM